MVGERLEELACPRGVAVGVEVREGKRTEQPCPGGALVVARVAPALIAAVASDVPRVERRQAAHAVGREEVPRARLDHGTTPRRRQRTVGSDTAKS